MSVWPFRHNWARPLVERLAWSTAVARAWNGAEERRSNRTMPRRALDQRVTVHGSAAAYADALLWEADRGLMDIPVWQDVSLLNAGAGIGAELLELDTSDRGFVVGARVLLLGAFDYHETVIITNVAEGQLGITALTKSWPIGATVYPLIEARLSGDYVSQRVTAGVGDSQTTWVQLDGIDADAGAPAATYRGVEVLTRRPNRVTPVSLSYERDLDVLDNTSGVITIEQRATRPRMGQRFEFITVRRADRASLMRFLFRRRGRREAFWHPSYQTDLKLLEPAAAPDTTIKVQSIGADSLYDGGFNRTDIALFTTSGVRYRRIVSWIGEVMTLDLPIGVPVGRDVMICFLTLSRLSTDLVELSHETAEVARCSISTVSLLSDEAGESDLQFLFLVDGAPYTPPSWDQLNFQVP